MPTRGKFIVIEGGDGAGKKTQTELLLKRLEQQGNTVTPFEFPQYTKTHAGALVGECLAGHHGDFVALSPRLASLPFTLDRVVAREDIRRELARGIVLCDRYTPSNTVFQAAKLEGEERLQFIEWLEELEYEELALPKPDLVIYLYIPEEVSIRLVEQREKRTYLENAEATKDLHEQDIAYQKKVVSLYRELAESRDDWHAIDCTEGEALLSREAVHEKIWRVMEPLLV